MKKYILLFIALITVFLANAVDIIWDESDAFKANLPDHESYSPFDMLDDQKRYEIQEEQKNDFNLSDEASAEADKVLGTEIVKSKDYISPDGGGFHKFAEMVLVNKITAKSKKISVSVGDNEYFGNIEILLEKCWYNGDLYKPSHKMLVKVVQHKLDEDPNQLYHGWLFSSDIPAGDIQSPTYEIIAMRCYD